MSTDALRGVCGGPLASLSEIGVDVLRLLDTLTLSLVYRQGSWVRNTSGWQRWTIDIIDCKRAWDSNFDLITNTS